MATLKRCARTHNSQSTTNRLSSIVHASHSGTGDSLDSVRLLVRRRSTGRRAATLSWGRRHLASGQLVLLARPSQPHDITHRTSHITHHTSHITHHTSHTQHLTHHTSHITHHTSRHTLRTQRLPMHPTVQTPPEPLHTNAVTMTHTPSPANTACSCPATRACDYVLPAPSASTTEYLRRRSHC
jgi:hypothetical protein